MSGKTYMSNFFCMKIFILSYAAYGAANIPENSEFGFTNVPKGTTTNG